MRTRTRENWLPIREAAARLGCTPEELHRRVENEGIPSVQTIGKTWIDLDAYLDTTRPVSGRPPRRRRDAKSGGDGAAVGWALAGILALVSVAGGSWTVERLRAIEGQREAERTMRMTSEANLASARRDLDHTRELLGEARDEIEHLSGILAATGEDVARRDLLAQRSRAGLEKKNRELRAQNLDLSDRIADLEAAPVPGAEPGFISLPNERGDSSEIADAPSPARLPDDDIQLSRRPAEDD